ncbi:MAG: hypothetical protein KGM42_11000 [Hyphomicrobiales bacterium]|nr:hypothetical protein [Hyphomicrobiales bacterium]
MRPDVDAYFRELGRTLLEEFMPRLPTAFEQGAAMRYAMLTQAAAEEFNRAAARRVEENGAVRALFVQAIPLVENDGLRERLRSAAATSDRSLLVRDLDDSNGRLRALLIELHAAVEAQTGAAARKLEDTIWAELSASTGRRALSLGRF